MFYQILFSPRDKRCAIIIYKRGIYELPNDLDFRKLGKALAQSHRKNKNFVSTSKELSKTRN